MRLRFYDHLTHVNRITTVINFVDEARTAVGNADCLVSKAIVSTGRISISSCHDQIIYFEGKI